MPSSSSTSSSSNPQSAFDKGHLAATAVMAALFIAMTLATGFYIRPAKPRPVWFTPLLSLGSLTFLVSLVVAIVGIVESLNSSYSTISEATALGITLAPLVSASSTISLAIVPFADVFLFPVMFMTLTHRMYSPIALAAPTSVARIVKAVFDGILVTITIIICMIMFGWGPLPSMPGVVFHILVVIDITATAFYVRYKLRDAGFKNDQIMRAFMRTTLPLTIFRIVYRLIANIIHISLAVDSLIKSDHLANTRLEYGLAITNRIVIGLTTLAIIGSLLRVGTPASAPAWNLQGKNATMFPGSTTFGSPGGVLTYGDKVIQLEPQAQAVLYYPQTAYPQTAYPQTAYPQPAYPPAAPYPPTTYPQTSPA